MVHPAATIYNRKLWPVLKKDIAMDKDHACIALPRSFYRRDTVTVAKKKNCQADWKDCFIWNYNRDRGIQAS